MPDRPSRHLPARVPRADARKNRELLLDAALELFTGAKDEVTLSAVAERAGARSQIVTEPSFIRALVSGSMKAPPPVARICTGPFSRR